MPFIGKQSTSNSQITSYTTTVGSGGQTNFTVVIEGGDETHVYLNGVLLKETTDYTVSSTQVSLVSAAVENDIVEIKVFRSFALADAVKATGGAFSGDVTVPNLTLSSNVIKASDGGSTITLDTSDNVTIAGGLTTTGGITNAGTISAGTIGTSVTFPTRSDFGIIETISAGSPLIGASSSQDFSYTSGQEYCVIAQIYLVDSAANAFEVYRINTNNTVTEVYSATGLVTPSIPSSGTLRITNGANRNLNWVKFIRMDW
tara:strand:+ start:46 stop:822 length:777 start_codon:yes stop_codon:yes gene_type:complete